MKAQKYYSSKYYFRTAPSVASRWSFYSMLSFSKGGDSMNRELYIKYMMEMIMQIEDEQLIIDIYMFIQSCMLSEL